MARGCHNCGVDLSQYKSYEDSPCATCPLVKEYNHTFSTGLFESLEASEENDDTDNEQPSGAYSVSSDALAEELDLGFAPKEYDLKTLEILRKVCQDQAVISLSSCIIKILKLEKRNPITVGILIKKLQFPYMSYSDIGDSMTPKCSKQNVLYHLKQAVQLFPELEASILTDTRFSGGRYALRTLAKDRRESKLYDNLRKALYGDDPRFKAFTMRSINALLKDHGELPDDIVDFDLYTTQDKE